MKKINPVKASEIIKKWQKKNDYVDRIWDLDDKLLEIGEALKGLRAVKAGRLFKEAQRLSDQIHYGLRSAGCLGPHFDFQKGKMRIFVNSRTIVKRIPLAF